MITSVIRKEACMSCHQVSAAAGSVLKGVAFAALILAVPVTTLAQPAPVNPYTEGEIAARGPLPGDVSLYLDELACSQALETPGYFSSINAAELADSTRSAVYPCATFTGSFDGPNRVFAWRSADDYQGTSYINNGMPGDLYIVGGEYPTVENPAPVGPFVAKADATTGEQIWRTYLDNPNASGHWIGNANLNILENGFIAFAWSNQIVLLDADTGRIRKHNVLPTGPANAEDVNFKHLTVAPDGTLILKDQTRPPGCTLQGTMAILVCAGQMGMTQANSVLVAVDPDTLEVIDLFELPEPATVPHVVTTYGDRIAIYVGMDKSGRRYFWDPEEGKFSADEDWVIHPMQEGQTTATAATLMGDWVAFQLNGLGSTTRASSVAVAHQDDASNMQVIFPFGELKPGEWSFVLPKAGGDPENNMIYSADMGVGKVAGIRLDPATGALDVAFVLDDITSTFQPVIGPKGSRVLLLTNVRLNNPNDPIRQAVFSSNYTEQMTWRDAATGKILAASDFFEPLPLNALTTPGFGGRIYYPTGTGFIVLQPMPVNQ